MGSHTHLWYSKKVALSWGRLRVHRMRMNSDSSVPHLSSPDFLSVCASSDALARSTFALSLRLPWHNAVSSFLNVAEVSDLYPVPSPHLYTMHETDGKSNNRLHSPGQDADSAIVNDGGIK